MTTSMCAGFCLKKFENSPHHSLVSRLESQKNQLNIEKSLATLRGDENFFLTYLSSPPARAES